MKKSIFFLSLLILSLLGCQDTFEESTQISVISKNKIGTANKRSYEEALLVAQQSISMLDKASLTRNAVPSRSLDLANGAFVVCTDNLETRSSCDSENDTLMYVFNFNDNKGFALVSANMQTEALLAITEQGFYDPSTECINKDFSYIIELAKQYVLRGDDNILAKNETITRADIDLWIFSSSIENLINVNWGQTNPEGLYCPNGACGCAITAMAMLMSSYNYPTSITIDYDSCNIISNYTLDWTEMKKHISKHQSGFSCNASTNAHNMISHLCRQLGKVARCTYYSSGDTATSPGKVISCLENYGYTVSDPGFIDFSEQNIVNELNNGHPVIMMGYYDFYWGQGHFWVVDGYCRYVISDSLDPNYGPPVYKYYNHINWGWDGDCNGYFLSGVFNTQGADTYDSFSTQNHDYTFYNIYYIAPYL